MLTAALIATQLACVHAPAVPAKAASDAVQAAPERDCNVVESERFTFHIDPWINLHHFLYEWARNVPGKLADDYRRPVDVAERTQLGHLTESEQEAWSKAVGFYRERLIQRDTTFDRNLIALRGELGALACADATARIGDAELWAVLTEAMPVYRRHWWPVHHASNAEWIRKEMALLRTYEAVLAGRLAEAYGGEWPAERVRVDVAGYSNWAGAYTTNKPNQLTISSGDYKDLEGLELLFHEVSHATFFEQRIFGDLAEAFQKHGAELPNPLVHLLQFITPAELLRAQLKGEDLRTFRAVGDQIIERGPMRPIEPVVRRHWKTFLDGQIDRRTAFERIAADLVQGP
jgi:hypothetical protein